MSGGRCCREEYYFVSTISMGQAWRKRQDAWVRRRRRRWEWQRLQVQVVINRIRQASVCFACALDAGLSNEYQERANEMEKSVQAMERRSRGAREPEMHASSGWRPRCEVDDADAGWSIDFSRLLAGSTITRQTHEPMRRRHAESRDPEWLLSLGGIMNVVSAIYYINMHRRA